MDAKHVGVLTYHVFSMLDPTNSFEDTKFRRSIFGQGLRAWSDLPDNPMIHGIWQKSPRQTTYFWFQLLQSLCLLFHTWIKNSRYHRKQGFIEARDNHHQSHIVLDSTTPSPVPDLFGSFVFLCRTLTFNPMTFLYKSRFYFILSRILVLERTFRLLCSNCFAFCHEPFFTEPYTRQELQRWIWRKIGGQLFFMNI
jgi:hypothetical protein